MTMPDALPTDAPPPIRKEPAVTKAPPQGKQFPCIQCGARLDFDPKIRGLQCPYCGHQEKIARGSDDTIVERDYLKYLENLDGQTKPIPGRELQTRCTGCGALVLLEENVVTDKCPFCATHLVNQPVAVAGMICPECLLPFSIDLRKAREKFDAWLRELWFAPTELKKIANLGQLSGVYVPFWTYDAMTYTFYEGQRGDNYTDYETYTVTDSNGNTRTETRTVIRIRWYSVTGEVQHFFDDVLVIASKSLPDSLTDNLEPWEIAKLEPFQPEFLSSFKTERYTIGLKEGFQIAKSLIEPEITRLICRDIGGDHQRVENKKSKYSAITFKHLLLPVWVAAYRYHDQTFQILINGRSGKVVGKRPWSSWKIARAAALVVVGVAAIVLLVVKFNR